MKITEKYLKKVIKEELQKEFFNFGKKKTPSAPTQAGTAPTQAGTAPTQAGTAPTQAGTAPTQAGYDGLSMANSIINNAIALSKKGKDVSGFIDLAIKHLMAAKKQGGEKINTSDPQNVTAPEINKGK